MKTLMKKLVRDERGVSALEYAVLAALVIGAVITALSLYRTGLGEIFTNLGAQITEAVGSAPTK